MVPCPHGGHFACPIAGRAPVPARMMILLLETTLMNMRLPAALGTALVLIGACAAPPPFRPGDPGAAPPRRVLRLDGSWQIQQGSLEEIPEDFPSVVPVPGLVDMARPAFQDVGRRSPLRQAFWYRRAFTVDGPVPDFAILKIHKARYGMKVWINGRLAGEHLPCFTPAYLDVRRLLNGDGAENEILVRVGADRDSMPQDMPTGWDFEKYLYIPGLYDSVDLILTGAPYLRNVQVVPDIEKKSVRIVAEVQAGLKPCDGFALAAAVAPAGSPGRTVAQGAAAQPPIRAGGVATCELTLSLPGCRLWSPEDPFLYELRVGTGADSTRLRFGMRSFRFDPGTKRAVLNGRPYYLRGTNVCIYRFFEDEGRGDRPWRAEWVRRLHEKFRGMNWNSMRYCIGFPPEFWYDIADETGFLIQDEFPIWLLGEAPEKPVAEKIIPEYTAWMRERWNHPCVVIWDAQNESNTKETGKALQAVRPLDLSNRPWENGWAEPQAPTDCVEAHPYLMIGLFNPKWGGGRKFSTMADMVNVPGKPPLNAAQRKIEVPILINEYAWLWLNRDGSTTCLTGPVYEKLLGPDSTVEQRRRLFARCLAAKTEFWRCHRECAGVLHFCGLGYSRAGDKPRPEGGATSDHFIDLEKLAFEPLFEEYLREAFSPVGLMLDLWDGEIPAGSKRKVRVYAINDLDREWAGPVRLILRRGDRAVQAGAREARIAALGREILEFEIAFPAETGAWELSAELRDADGRPVRSRREFQLK